MNDCRIVLQPYSSILIAWLTSHMYKNLRVLCKQKTRSNILKNGWKEGNNHNSQMSETYGAPFIPFVKDYGVTPRVTVVKCLQKSGTDMWKGSLLLLMSHLKKPKQNQNHALTLNRLILNNIFQSGLDFSSVWITNVIKEAIPRFSFLYSADFRAVNNKLALSSLRAWSCTVTPVKKHVGQD